MSSDRFQVIAIDAVNVIELSLPQILDSDEFDRLNDKILNALGGKAGARWVIDLAEVSYLGSSALGLMVNIRQRVKQAGGRLVLCGLSQRLLEIFHTCCLERLFTIVRDREEAIRTAKA